MLTQSEREWLEDRKHKAYCRYCNGSKLCANPFASGYSCPLTGNMKDAADFSERVAMKLAQVAAMQKKHHCCVDIDVPFHCPGWKSCAERIMSKKGLCPCAFEMLKGVRLEVEEEMENV